jgi:hypothetical protein
MWTKRRGPFENRGIDWSYAATSQGTPSVNKSWKVKKVI